MYFSQLPKKIQEGIVYLTKDKVFKQQLNEDKVLDDLDDQEIDYDYEKLQTEILLGRRINLFNHLFKPISALALHILWTHRCPVICGKGEYHISDVDMFFYVIETEDPEDVLDRSKNFTLNNYADIAEQIPEVIHTLMKTAFSPLSLFPATEAKGGDEAIFDAEWLCRTCAIAMQIEHEPFAVMMHRSLLELEFMLIEYAKMNGTQNIGRTPPQEILRQKDFRICELIVNRLCELNIITEDQKEDLVKTMTTKPEEDNNNG